MSNVSFDRRTFTIGGIATVLGAPALCSLVLRDAAAQGATPPVSSALADLGLPELNITVTADSFEGVPSEIPAGRYLVNAALADRLENGAIDFIQPPAGHTTDELLGIIGMFAQMEASPAAMDMSGTPASGGEQGGAPPPVIYQSLFAGGIAGPGGATVSVVLDLPPGDWILWGDDPTATQQPVTFTATGDMPADLAAPTADITVTLVDFGISVDGSMTAGDHVVQVTNEGAEPHFLFMMKAPDGITDDQLGMLLGLPDGATPPADMPYKESDFMPVLSTDTQSIGTSVWTTVTLEAGTYAAACFFPTAGTGEPHAMKGMHTVFTVS